MERKVGEIFKFSGEWYQCVEDEGCGKCDLRNIICRRDTSIFPFKACSSNFRRTDRKSVIFKKLKKIGEPFLYKGKQMQSYIRATDELICNWNNNLLLLEHGDSDIIDIELKQNKEDMGDNAEIRPYDELFSPGTVSNTKHLTKEDMEEKEPTYEELLHYYHSTVGLWAIDRSPQEVDLDWICKNAFQLGMDRTLPNCERTEKNLKSFNLEAAKSGKPVYTRDGRKARIVCFDSNGGRPIVALVTECDDEEEIPYKYHCDGSYNCQSIPSDNDLIMLSEKKEGWVNVYTNINIKNSRYCSTIYASKEEALNNISKALGHYISTGKTEWEE